MAYSRLSAAVFAVALMSAAAGTAHAADKGRPIDFTVRTEPTAAAPQSGVTTRWDASTRHWGVTVNLQQPNARPSTLNDVQAGAYYRITPSLRVGGSVALGSGQELQRFTAPAAVRPADAPKVRLETAFK